MPSHHINDNKTVAQKNKSNLILLVKSSILLRKNFAVIYFYYELLI